MNKVKMGLFGWNGHQIRDYAQYTQMELVAVAGWTLESGHSLPPDVRVYETFEQLLQHPGLQLVSICSPFREQQVTHILAALHAGCHVYAEKPLVMDAGHLRDVLRLAKSKNLHIREMASTAYESPFVQLKQLVEQNKIGDVIQISAQKSYPYAPWRPQNEAVDGGILLQAGIHLVRAIECVAGHPITAVSATQSKRGNPQSDGGLHMAGNFHFQFSHGGSGVATVNYLNVASTQLWGNDRFVVFGSHGCAEWSAQRNQIQLYTVTASSVIDCSTIPTFSHFQQFIQEIRGESHTLLPIEQEIHPLQVVLAARQSAQIGGQFVSIDGIWSERV